MASGNVNQRLRFTTDKEVTELRKQLEGSHISESCESMHHTSKFANFTPGSHCVVFEGGREDEDVINFRRYSGEVLDHHKTRRCYEAFLAASTHLSSPEDQFTEKFADQYQLIEILHNEEQHGSLRIVGRFGKYYYFDDPPAQNMSVAKLNTYGGKAFKKGERMFRSAFVSRELKHETLEATLLQKGYQQKSEEEKYRITLNPTGGKSRISLTVILNSQLEFEELRYPGFKWVQFNLIRKNHKMRDVRLAVESVRETTTQDVQDPAVEKYKNATILIVEGEEVKVNPEFRQEVLYVRRKNVKKFKRELQEGEEGFYPEVHLLRIREFDTRDASSQGFKGTPEWKEEVVINATSLLPAAGDMDAIKNFAPKFMSFCFELESGCS